MKETERARTGTRESARQERMKFMKRLCELRRAQSVDFYLGAKTPYYFQVGQFDHLFDHLVTWRHRSGVLRWDDPYRQSRHMQEESVLRAFGFQIVHLPLEMSLHVRGECQPRLIALPGVDLEHIKRLLVEVGFETPLTREFWVASDELWEKQYGNFARVTGSADVIK